MFGKQLFICTSGITFASHNGLSVVDYLLCSVADSQYVSNLCILNFNEFSDHSPIMFSLLSKYSVQQTQNNSVQESRGKTKLFYDEAKVSIFRNQLNTCDCILAQLTNNVNIDQVDSIVQSFTNYVYDYAVCALRKTGRRNVKFKPKNLWFYYKCIQARDEFK